MSLLSFLQEKGYIEKKTASKTDADTKSTNDSKESVPPTYFPLFNATDKDDGVAVTTFDTENKVAKTSSAAPLKIDPAFIKFFEDELVKANLPGPDYFEFRKQMITMYQKMANKGASAEVILQAVLTSFEAQDVPPVKLIEAAKTYKEVISNKKDDFLKGAAAEKNKQLQNRQTALQTHQDNLHQMQAQLEQLQRQIGQITEEIKKEQTKAEVDKSLGKEGIEKIENAEKQITYAYDYMVSSIEADINRLRSV